MSACTHIQADTGHTKKMKDTQKPQKLAINNTIYRLVLAALMDSRIHKFSI